MKRSIRVFVSVLIALFALLHPANAVACAVCYGEPDSPASQGLTWAILALGVIVLGVLGGVIAFFIHMNRKSRALAAQTPELILKGAQ